VPAEILEPALARRLAGGATDFVIVPLFFGPSRALTDYLPERVAHLRETHPALRVRVAAPLFQPEDDRLARILADQIGRGAAASRSASRWLIMAARCGR
jgi:sirohydrochlorin ferrochelatase